jgi:hypothetical protein
MKKDKSATPDIAYNTQQEFLIMPEYGRNVQQLVRHAQRIENPVYRQQFCEQIVDLIQQLYPQAKNVEDYREKLWKHIFQIAKYKLDAHTPSGQVPTPEDARMRPERVPYPQTDTRFRHYGNHVQKLIRRAIEMEEGPVKDGYLQTIGSYMKLAYKTWNREHFVSDDMIKTDLDLLSGGKLSIEENTRIDGLSNASRLRSRDIRTEKDSRSSNNNNRNSSNNQSKNVRDNRDNKSNDRDNRNSNNRNSNNSVSNKNGNSNNNNNRNKRK